MRYIALLLLLFNLTSALAAPTSRSFYQAYQTINYSIRGGKMQFYCDRGETQYRLQSSFGSRAKLYWLGPNNKWQELPDVVFTDTSISFEGMERQGGLELNQLSKNINLPIFNRHYKNIPERYFYKAKKPNHTPYLFVIDMVEQTSTARNIEAIEDKLLLDKRRYLLEQAYQSPIRSNDQGRQALQHSLANERKQLLEAISLQYENGIRVATPPYQHKIKSHCYL